MAEGDEMKSYREIFEDAMTTGEVGLKSGEEIKDDDMRSLSGKPPVEKRIKPKS